MMERGKRFDAEIDCLRNKTGQSGNIIKSERRVSPDDDDYFDGISDENYDSVSLDHENQFGKPRNHKY